MTSPPPPPPPTPLAPTGPAQPIAAAPETYPQAAAPGHYPPSPPLGAAPLGAVTRPRTLENPEIGLRERAVLALLRGDEAPRSIAVRFGLPIEEVFYWLDVYREAGRRSLGG